jgi:transcription elongation GreA/GreB family factor
MNKAFVKEDDDSAAERLPDRGISPHPNLVTAEGLALIDKTITKLGEERAAAKAAGDAQTLARIARDLRYWAAREATAQLTEPRAGETVQFGSRVSFRRADGRTQTYRIVGIDEADPAEGSLSYVSPVAQALLGREIGDEIEIGGNPAEIIDVN